MQHGEVYYPNQSVNGLINRLVGNGNSLEWRSDAFAPYDSAVYVSTVVAALLLTGGVLLWRRTMRATPIDLDCQS